MTKEEIIKELYRGNSKAIKEAIKVLEQETVSKEVYDSEHFARKEAEYELWKIKEQQPSDNCVSRQAVNEYLEQLLDGRFDDIMNAAIMGIKDNINAMPPVTPTQCIAAVRFSKDDLREICNERIEVECTHGTCKDCKHWKDSDGVYRRGIGAESKCPINIKEVYEGNFYCKWFEERGSENEVD